MPPFHTLWSSASLPHSATLPLAYIVTVNQTSHCLTHASFAMAAGDDTLRQSLLRKGLFCLQRVHWKQVLAMFIILANKDKFKEIRGRTWQSTGCSCWPSCAMILNWSITSETQLFSTASLVQLSCRSHIFGNSHYFRNECSCVFIANHMPALSTIKEIRIQQTYSSN